MGRASETCLVNVFERMGGEGGESLKGEVQSSAMLKNATTVKTKNTLTTVFS